MARIRAAVSVGVGVNERSRCRVVAQNPERGLGSDGISLPLAMTSLTNASISSPPSAGEAVARVRAFNRFYTNVIGVLKEGLLRTPYSLTEARVIFELAQRETAEVGDLRRALDVDAGYLSRILSRFESDGIITKQRSKTDGRRQVIELTDGGRASFEMLDRR